MPGGMPQGTPGYQPMVIPQTRMPRADICMVFPYKTSALVRWGEAQQEEEFRGLKPPSDAERHKMETWQSKRNGIITALSDCGLVLMLYYSRDRDEIFVKVAAEEKHLRMVAEMKRYKLELKEEYLAAFAEYKNDYAGQRDLGYADRCVVSHLYKMHIDPTDEFEGQAYPEAKAIFRTADRIQLIDHIIRSADHDCAGIDVGQLLHDQDLLHYFPLHENRRLVDLDKDWFKAFVWGTSIHKIRDYYGERIAMYFLFLSHFTKWLMLPAICGASLHLVSVVYGTPDNYTGLVVVVGVVFWASFFIHWWRRLASTFALKWGTLGMSSALEPTRPKFQGVSRINPVTQRIDRYYPWSERIFKVLFSYSVLTVAMLVVAFIVCCLFYLRHVFHKNGGRFWFQLINAVVVEVLNAVFTQVAMWLTERENHRSYTEHSNHLLAKTIIFKFVNSYGSLYYIAFFKEHSQLFGMPMTCMYNPRLESDDCLRDLGWQLGIFIVVRLTLQNFVEFGLPYIQFAFRRFREGRQFYTNPFSGPSVIMGDASSAEKQSKKEDYDLYADMDEILILYGYTTLFVVACPWVPMLTFVTLIIEIFLDEKKLVLLHRRPMPQPAANNEPWDTAFDAFSLMAMLTNCAVIIFSGHTFDHWSHGSKIRLLMLVEFSCIAARMAAGLVLPDIPRQVRLLQLQQRVLVQRHINGGGVEDDSETRASAMRTTAHAAPFIFDRDDEEDYW